MQPASVDIVSQSIRDASTSRYFIGAYHCAGKIREAPEWTLTSHGWWVTAAGAVVLFYDHLITLPDECRFVWKAKPSFAKYAFLLNRYAVLSVMVLVLPGMCQMRKVGVNPGAH